MGKEPGFYFYTGDWLKDPALLVCSKAAKGCWIDMLCVLAECPIRGVFSSATGDPWTEEQIAGAVGGDTAENRRCIDELLRLGVASRLRSGAIYSRRIYREYLTKTRQRNATRERVRKHRDKQRNQQQASNITSAARDVTLSQRRCTEEEREREALLLDSFSLKKSAEEKLSFFSPVMQRIQAIGFRRSKEIGARYALSQELANGADPEALVQKLTQIFAWTERGTFVHSLEEAIRRWEEPQNFWQWSNDNGSNRKPSRSSAIDAAFADYLAQENSQPLEDRTGRTDKKN